MNTLQDRRILHLCWRLAPKELAGNTLFGGGLQKIMASIVADSRAQGASVFVGSNDSTSPQSDTAFPGYPRVDHLSFPFGEKRKTVTIIARLVGAMKRHRIDLVHCHDRHSALCGWTAAKLLNLPMVYTAHGMFTDGRWMGRCFGRNIVAVSEAVTDNLVNVFGVCPNRVTVIHNGCDLSSSSVAEQRAVRMRLRISEGDRPVAVIGRLSAEKGHECLIRALPEVTTQHPQIKVLIVGEGCRKGMLHRLAVVSGVDRHVVFCGHQDDVAPFIDVSCFTVLPSLREGFGMAVVESFLLGKPVVASLTGGVPEIVTHGTNGMLVPPGSPHELAQAICFMLAHPDRASGMGMEGQKLARTEFSLNAMFQRYRDYYAAVLLAAAHGKKWRKPELCGLIARHPG